MSLKKTNTDKYVISVIDLNGNTRKRRRLKTKCKDACQRDTKSTGLTAGEVMERATWTRKVISPTGNPQENPGEKKNM